MVDANSFSVNRTRRVVRFGMAGAGGGRIGAAHDHDWPIWMIDGSANSGQP